MKCYKILPTDNIAAISQGILAYIRANPEEIGSRSQGVWHFVDCKQLLAAVPELVTFFRQYNLIPRHAAVTVITQDGQLPVHTDEPPVVAKINFPVQNTRGWANRWYEDGKLIAEILDMSQPVVFKIGRAHV